MTVVLRHPITRGASALLDEVVAQRPSLPRQGEVFLWLLDLPSLPLESMLKFATEAERGADDRRRYRTDFEPWLKSRAALRRVLSAFTGQPARQIAITTGNAGKPELADNPDSLHFNASRSKDCALIALARGPVGVDIEAVRPEFGWRTIAMHWFHPREQALLASAPEARRAEIFFQIWTHKEAYFKGVGTGLDREAMTSCFTAPESRSIRGLNVPQSRGWRIRPLAAPSGYKASLASADWPQLAVDRTASLSETSRPLS